MSVWPEPTTIVQLSWERFELEARVLESGAQLLVCTAAQAITSPLPTAPTPATVVWANGSGLHRRDGQMSSRDEAIHVVGSAAPQRIQRRRFYRAQIATAVDLLDGLARTPGVTIDLSEGGARVRVEGRPPPVTASVTTKLDLDGAEVDVPSRVVRATEDDRGGEVGVSFSDLGDPIADQIRRRVFTAQLDARRNGQLT